MNRNSKGYTLIELLVVITISIIVFGVGLAGYREFSRRQALTGILKQVKADLRLAQQLALTGQKPETCAKLIGYTFTATSSNYKIIASCSGGSVENKSADMPVNTTISAGSLTFKILGQGTSLSSSLTFTITNSVAGTTGTVIVGTGGDIN
ncbi:MAG: hypothetical protein ACD_19C00176G0055 [uncultured bacterium]|nr:MAG: hypothetical protein ACD_19C00176G0055 [uncultured bacterium]HBY01672.1 hypothetical protein [Rikenellaceae bacterium]